MERPRWNSYGVNGQRPYMNDTGPPRRRIFPAGIPNAYGYVLSDLDELRDK